MPADRDSAAVRSLGDPYATGTLLTCAGESASVRVGALAFGVVLTAAAAQVSVPLPFTPVPFTFQPMVVLICGAALGPRIGLLSQIVYLTIGAAGVPVFAASPLLPQGITRLLGPTAGFLLSYPLAAYIAGRFAERGLDRRYWSSVAAMAAGLLPIFALGVLWLALWPAHPLGFQAALRAGFYPFVAMDLIKLLVAAGALPALWRLIGQEPPTIRT